MELTLNLVWVCIAAAALWLWPRTERLKGTSLWSGLLTLACALLVLFPAVSISDDLQAASTAMEDRSDSLRNWTPGAQHSVPAVATAPAISHTPRGSTAPILAPIVPAHGHRAAVRATRGPPLS
ncbi:MAG TPA: hypothetical protein VFA60_06815 [Terriglobales bacterium]|nr:hypothetical protein [Terriglobales bacterium]